ncbi:MAG TPA: hypothetical protein VF198_17225, partial [Vicinamibacterales bacterium]
MRVLLVAATCMSAACSGLSRPETPGTPITMAVVNARVWTGDRGAPWAEGLAVAGERLVAVGSNGDIRALATNVDPIDAGGRLIV